MAAVAHRHHPTRVILTDRADTLCPRSWQHGATHSLGGAAMAAHRTTLEERRQDSAPPAPAPAVPWPGALAVGGVAALVYGLTRSAVPALTHDSLNYLVNIQTGGYALYHPHHLAYNAVARAWLNALGAVGLGGDPLPRVEVLNSLFGGVAVALVWTLLRLRARLTPGLALAATAGAAASFGVWFYSVSIEVYVLPLALLLATLLVLTRPRLTLPTMAAVGVLNGLAVVAHQVNVLFAAVVVVVAVHRVDRRTAGARLAAYGAAAAAVVAGAYGAVLALVVRPGSPGEAADWFTRYAQSSGYWHVTPKAPLLAAVGFSRSLVGGQFAFRFGAVRDRMASAFPGKSLDDEAFLVRHLSPAAAGLLIAAGVTGAALLFWMLGRGSLRRRDLPDPARRLARPLVAWLVAYAVFFLFWEPTNVEFWIPQATVLWLLAAVLASGRRDPASARRGALVLAVAACAVGLANLVGTVLPATSAANDIYAVRYRALGEAVGRGDVVVVDRPHLGVGYAVRYTEATPLAADSFSYIVSLEHTRAPEADELADRAARALRDGHRVAVDADLVDAPSDPTAAHAGTVFAARFGSRWHLVDVPGAPAGWYLVDP